MLEEKVLFLRLSPEFGGTRFGHFEQRVVRLGSDPGCDIAIAQGFGVAAEHVQVLFDGPGNIIVAPADRAADVYLWKPDSNRPDLITTPTAVRPGDAFALATPNGPRFIVELGELPPEVKAQREKAQGFKMGGRKLTGKAMADEVKRQAWTSLLVMGPMQLVQRAVIFVKSGAILQPRNIILGITILGGYIIGGASFCRSKKDRANLTAVNERYEGCQTELDIARGGSNDPVKMEFSELVEQITSSVRIAAGLKKDRKFMALVKDKVRAQLAAPDDYEWLLKGKTRRVDGFVRWRNLLLETDGLNGDTVKVASWLAAPRNALANEEFTRLLDSESNDQCARGDLSITYRQAVHLGLATQVDAFHRGPAASMEDKASREPKLEETAATVGQELPEAWESDIAGVGTSGKEYCIFIDGEDERTKRRALRTAVKRHFEASSPGVPAEAGGAGVIARVARFYSAELPNTEYDPGRKVVTGIDFMRNKSVVSRALEDEGARGEWVLNRTADVFARSIAVPCIGVLDPDKDEAALKQTLGEPLPNPIYCLVLNYKLNND